jgi:hypothetical protein
VGELESRQYGVPSLYLPEINEEGQKVSTQVAGLGAQIPNRDF